MNELDKIIDDNIAKIERFVLLKSVGITKDIAPIISFNSDDVQPCTASNHFQLYINTNNFNEFHLTDFMSLINKCVVYLIYTNEGIYVGQSKDFNDRMHSHIKDAVKIDYPLYNSFKNNNKIGFVSILHCFEGTPENENIIRGIENLYTNELLDIKRNNESLAQYIFNTNK